MSPLKPTKKLSTRSVKMEVYEFLAHHGVRGMHWGSKRSNSRTSSRTKSKTEIRRKRVKKLKTAATLAFLTATLTPAIMEGSVRALNSAVLAKQVSNGEKFVAQKAAERLSNTHGLGNYQTVHLNYNPSTGVWG
jgi:hypothetical protein